MDGRLHHASDVDGAAIRQLGGDQELGVFGGLIDFDFGGLDLQGCDLGSFRECLGTQLGIDRGADGVISNDVLGGELLRLNQGHAGKGF